MHIEPGLCFRVLLAARDRWDHLVSQEQREKLAFQVFQAKREIWLVHQLL